jgi:hypothetical protein
MAEVEVGGIKFTGGKMAAVLMALSTAAGIVWGAAEFWGDYMDMKERIEAYEAPDLSHIEQELAVQKETVNRVNADVNLLLNDTRDAMRRLYELETETQRELIDIRKSIGIQIEEALKNPLAN